MYIIIKHVKNKKTGKRLPVVLLNSDSEVWEFKTESEAQKISDIFNLNSDSGHFYQVKKL